MQPNPGFISFAPNDSHLSATCVPAGSVALVRPGSMNPTLSEVVINPALVGQPGQASSIYTKEPLHEIGERLVGAGLPVVTILSKGIADGRQPLTPKPMTSNVFINPAAIRNANFTIADGKPEAHINVLDGHSGLYITSPITQQDFGTALNKANVPFSHPKGNALEALLNDQTTVARFRHVGGKAGSGPA